MSTPEPPPYPGDPTPGDQNSGASDLPAYGSVPPPPDVQGSVPPPPPPPAAPLGSGEFSAPDAIAWGWLKFTQNVGPVLLASVTIVAVGIVLGAISSIVSTGAAQTTPMGPGSMNFAFNRPGSFIGELIQTVVSLVLSGVAAKAALEVTEGQPYNFFAAFGKVNYVRLIIASLLVGVLVTIGFILLIIPGLIVLFLTYLTTYSLVDDDKTPIDAIKHSISLVSANVGSSLLLGLLSIVVLIAGVLALCVGLLVAMPITIFAAAYAYRAFNGQAIAP